jgi:hypothetical protein
MGVVGAVLNGIGFHWSRRIKLLTLPKHIWRTPNHITETAVYMSYDATIYDFIHGIGSRNDMALLAFF